MINNTSERLYNLLPSIYRIRDAKEGEPLRALLSVIENEMLALEEDIDGLYEDWFIETCADWIIPYIGDCLGVHGIFPLSARAGNTRAYIANTLAYRRRKGTAFVLEQVAHDITGWPAHAVEFFLRLAVTQNLNHPRLSNASIDLRDLNGIELVNGPFEMAAHAADVRKIETARGRYNIPNLGIFLWRLQSYPIGRNNNVLNRPDTGNNTWSTARKSVELDSGYRFDPTGRDIQLFNRPQTETSITHLSEEVNVPGILRRICLYEDLEMYRRALLKGEIPKSLYFGKQPVLGLALILEEGIEEISPEEIVIADLSVWSCPPSEIEYLGIANELVSLPIRAAVDPLRGRLSLAEGITPKGVLVSYSYGFSGDVGAGPYDHSESIRQFLSRSANWQVGVSQEKEAIHNETIFKTIGQAVAEWNKQPPGTLGMILIMDSRTYEEDLTINIPETSQLLIVASDWPEAENPDSSLPLARKEGQFAARGLRPHLLGRIEVHGTADVSANHGSLLVSGLLIEGKLIVGQGNLGGLQVNHCTLVPGIGGMEVLAGEDALNDSLKIALYRTICGEIALCDHVPILSAIECIIDPKGAADKTGLTALRAGGTMVEIEASTIMGSSEMRILSATNSIFTDRVSVKQRQRGCVRFSFLPYNSHTPKRFRCQPDLALRELAVRLGKQSVIDLSIAQTEGAQTRLRPVFTSINYGDSGYAQLDLNCPEEIRIGSEDGSEMGVFGILKEYQREANLRAALDEYMRFGLDAGIFYIT